MFTRKPSCIETNGWSIVEIQAALREAEMGDFAMVRQGFFQVVQGRHFLQLRRRLAVYAGQGALPDITIDPPRGTSDELSFLRMVAWAYVLFLNP